MPACINRCADATGKWYAVVLIFLTIVKFLDNKIVTCYLKAANGLASASGRIVAIFDTNGVYARPSDAP